MIIKNIYLNIFLIFTNTFFAFCFFKDSEYIQTFHKIYDYKSALQNSPFKVGMLLIYSTGCIHCHRFAPTYKQLAEHFKDKMFFFAMKSNSEYHKEFKITGYPTIYYYSNGKYTEHTGNRKFEYMEKIINEKYLVGCKNISIVDIDKIYKDNYINSIKRNLIIGYFDKKTTNNNKNKISEFKEVSNKLMNQYIDLCFYCFDYKPNNVVNDNMIFSYSKQRGNSSFVWEQNKTYNDYEYFLYNDVINIYEDISNKDKSYILDALNDKKILLFVYSNDNSLKNNYIEFVNGLYNITQDKKNKSYEYIALKKGVYDSKLKKVQKNKLYLVSDNFKNIKEYSNISMIKEEIMSQYIGPINYENINITNSTNDTDSVNNTNNIKVDENDTRVMRINEIFGNLQIDDKQEENSAISFAVFFLGVILLIISIFLIKKYYCIGYTKVRNTYFILGDQGDKIEFN